MSLLVLAGASGAGKTTISRRIQAQHAQTLQVFFFDDIGVPPPEVMTAEYGSGEGWQRAMTLAWMQRLAPLCRTGCQLLLEGQTRLAFLAEGARAAGALPYRPLLIDCDDATRRRRLSIDRGQPELANDDMLQWAKWLRAEARQAGCGILDTSALSLDEAVAAVMSRLPA